MTNKICKDCKWNNYPTCKGIIMHDGNEMRIDYLSPNFQCGRKDMENSVDFSIEIKTDAEKKINELEFRISELEKKLL